MKVSVLGPEGTYSSQAARELVPGADLMLAASNPEAIHRVAMGEASSGVVPIENSIGGIVTAAYDGLFRHNLIVTDQTVLDIHHTLAGAEPLEPPNYKNITRILSHPQGLAQCAGFLEKHFPGAELKEMNSTVEGMAIIAETKDINTLAIGPDPAVARYGLTGIKQAIEDEPGNQTRFVTFGRGATSDVEQDFVIVAVVPDEDRPGLIHDITGVFKDHEVNLSRLDSRPMRTGLGLSMFYVELDMKSQDPRYDLITGEVQTLGSRVVRMSA